MKKKKGFTLIELLSVIVILSMIALIAVPVVYKSIQSSREKAYALQVENIEAQAKKWAEMNTSELPNEDNDLVFVKVLDLKQEGYIKEEDIVDPRNNKAMNGCVVIQYDASYNQYEYTYKEEECDTLKTDEYQPIIVIEGIKNLERLTDTVEVNTVYQYPNVKATDYKGSPIEVMGPVIMEKGKNTVISDVDTSVIDKEFELIYTAYDAKKDTEKKVIVTVTVVDTTPPVITVNGHTTDFSITIEAGESFAVPTATATDNSRLTPTLDTSGSVNIKVPGNYKITYTATDSKGNIKTLVLTVKVVDTISPIVTISGNPTAWTNQNVTIVVNASDSGSGLASSAYSYDGGSTWTTGNSKIISSNTTLNIWVKDNAGNITKNTVVVDKIDKTIPDVTFTVTSGTSGLNYWYISNVGVKMTPSSGNSGVASYKYCTTTSDSCTPSTLVSGSGTTTVTLSTESATNKICVLVTSVSGQQNTKCSGNYKIDKTTPDATFAVTSGTLGSNSWYTSNVGVKITPSSGNSGVSSYKYCTTTSDSCTPSTLVSGSNPTTVTLSTESSTNKICVLVTSVSGQTNTKCSGNYKIDKSAPDATFAVTSGTLGSNSWYTSNVEVKIATSAGNSGVASYKYCTTTSDSCTPNTTVSGSGATTVTLSTESATNKICVLVTSGTGQTNTKCSGNYKIDKSAPTLAVNGHTSDYTVTIEHSSNYTIPTGSATDNLTTPSVTRSGSVTPNVEGTYTVTYTATDDAGNSKTLKLTVQVKDTIPPTVEITGNPTSWTNQNVTIAVKASDSGTGLASSAYSYDGGSTWTTGNSTIVSSNTTLNIWVQDKAGNITKNTVVIDKIDKTLPDVTFTVTSGTTGSNYWYTSNIGVKITPSAGNSGVSSYKYCTTTGDSCTPSTTVSGSNSATVTLSTESSTNKICVSVTSVSGQTNTKCSGNYKIDKSVPTLTVDGHTSDYSVVMEPSSSYTIPTGSATDNLTQNPSVTTSGSVTPTIEGTYTVTYTATDDAGNSKTLILTVQVKSNTYIFEYTGDIQEFVVPTTGIYKLEVWGAQGGHENYHQVVYGGLGGYAVGSTLLIKGQILYIGVGGGGSTGGYPYLTAGSGGYNGGASGVANSGTNPYAGGGGGGATHIATVSGILSSLASNQTAVLIVGGGGGGAWFHDYTGVANDSETLVGGGGAGGGTTTNGVFGSGTNGSGQKYSTGGGGGGYYGGQASNGGSSYVSDLLTSSSMVAGERSGNGYAKITFIMAQSVTEYSITYHLNGGTFETQPKNSYNVTDAFDLPIPTKDGYVFKGWYENSSLTGEAVTAIALNTTGNKVFYAKWDKIVSYELLNSTTGVDNTGGFSRTFSGKGSSTNPSLSYKNNYYEWKASFAAEWDGTSCLDTPKTFENDTTLLSKYRTITISYYRTQYSPRAYNPQGIAVYFYEGTTKIGTVFNAYITSSGTQTVTDTVTVDIPSNATSIKVSVGANNDGSSSNTTCRLTFIELVGYESEVSG